jgi:uncharacterized protein DUF6958
VAKTQDKVECRTPTPGKKPTRIDRWKFDAVRKAILAVLPRKGEGVLFTELTPLVKAQLMKDELAKLGVPMWYVTVVKLELEVRGEIRRVKDVSPQRLLRAR